MVCGILNWFKLAFSQEKGGWDALISKLFTSRTVLGKVVLKPK